MKKAMYLTEIIIISGGQTGIDQLALAMAYRFGLATGGFMPRGFRTENGLQPEIGEKYKLIEMETASWTQRTKKNINESDATVLFGSLQTTGAKVALRHACKVGKEILSNPDASTLLTFIKSKNISVLNIAGNRSSLVSKDDYEFACQTLEKVFSDLSRLQ